MAKKMGQKKATGRAVALKSAKSTSKKPRTASRKIKTQKKQSGAGKKVSAARTLALNVVKKPLQKGIRGIANSSSYKMVDDLLLRLSPNVESQLDKISQMVETNAMAVNELKSIGFKVLQKAMEVSTSLKSSAGSNSRRKPTAAKR